MGPPKTALDRARKLIAASLETLSTEKFIELSPSEALANITLADSLEVVARDADLAIEAINEDVQAQKTLFARLDQLCPAKTILVAIRLI